MDLRESAFKIIIAAMHCRGNLVGLCQKEIGIISVIGWRYNARVSSAHVSLPVAHSNRVELAQSERMRKAQERTGYSCGDEKSRRKWDTEAERKRGREELLYRG